MSNLIPLDSFFSTIPVPYTKTLQERTFTSLNGKLLQGYILKGQKCLTLSQLTDHIPNGKYSTIKKAFNRAKSEYNMKKGKDYEKVERELFSPSGMSQGPSVFLLYRSGVLLTLANMQRKFKARLLYYLVHYFFDSEDKKGNLQIYDGKYNLYELPTFPGKRMARDGTQHGSKLEISVYERALNLGYPIARMDFLSKKTLKSESKKIIESNLGKFYPGLDFDYHVLTEPLTIVDVWGMNDPFYQKKCLVKKEVCKVEGFRLISILDTDTIPQIDNKLKKIEKD